MSRTTLGNPWLLSLAVTFLKALRVSNQGYDWVLACCIRDSNSTRLMQTAPRGGYPLGTLERTAMKSPATWKADSLRPLSSVQLP